jgi:signal peptidase I
LADLLTPGDVVVLQRNTEYHVKRIIAVAGQTVDYEVGWLMVNGKKTIWVGGNFPFKGQLKPDEFYVIGDNIFVSLDSRFLGPIKPDDICGKVHLCQKIGP